jgi:hypothetical protein
MYRVVAGSLAVSVCGVHIPQRVVWWPGVWLPVDEAPADEKGRVGYARGLTGRRWSASRCFGRRMAGFGFSKSECHRRQKKAGWF